VAVPSGTPALGRLRSALIDARAAGASFYDVWLRAVRDSRPDNLTRAMLEEEAVRESWKRAFERVPATAGDRAAARLGALVDGEEVAPAPTRLGRGRGGREIATATTITVEAASGA
jgi:hypothetical protein